MILARTWNSMNALLIPKLTPEDQKILDRIKETSSGAPITTKLGDTIIPYHVCLIKDFTLSSNLLEFQGQPRVQEIRQILEKNIDYKNGDTPALDGEGHFYSKNTNTKLGQIDPEVELDIFKEAATQAYIAGQFGDISPENPMILNQESGELYIKNNPEDKRGIVKLGPEIIVS